MNLKSLFDPASSLSGITPQQLTVGVVSRFDGLSPASEAKPSPLPPGY